MRLIRLYILPILILLSALITKAQHVDINKLNVEISEWNNGHHYDSSILTLQTMLEDPEMTPYDRYLIYMHKYFTYKRISDYTNASENLSAAEVEGLKSSHKKEVKNRIAVEKLFVKFDLRDYSSVEKILPTFLLKINLSLLDKKTYGFLLCLEAFMATKNNYTEIAEKKLDTAYKIFKQYAPKHIAMVCTKLIDLQIKEGNIAKMLEYYKIGVENSKEYHLDIYERILHEKLGNYYQTKNEPSKSAYYFKMAEFTTINNSITLRDAEKVKQIENSFSIIKQNKSSYIQYGFGFFALLILLISIVSYSSYRRAKFPLIPSISFDNNQTITSKLDTVQTCISLDSLNSRQHQVANLVIQGKSNKEIAQLLYISENTVKYHLKTIYSILHISSRKELQCLHTKDS